MPKILEWYFREIPMVEKLYWQWLPRLKKGERYGAGSWKGGGHRLYILRWGWWQIEFYIW